MLRDESYPSGQVHDLISRDDPIISPVRIYIIEPFDITF